MIIGSKIKELRKKNNLTQKELAKLLGLSASTIQKYELEQREPTLETLSKMSEIFGVPLDTFNKKYLQNLNLKEVANINNKKDDFKKNYLGEKIKKLRIQKGWSLEQLSTNSNIAETTISEIESGSRPSYDELEKLSIALDVFCVDLLKYDLFDGGNLLIDKIQENEDYGNKLIEVSLSFLYNDVIKKRFKFNFELLSQKEQKQIINSVFLAIDLKLDEILQQRNNGVD